MMKNKYIIREMKPEDWKEVAKIYQAGIDTNIATFREVLPSWEEWDSDHLKFGRWVVVSDRHEILGFIALSPTSIKEAYSGVCEVSIYVSEKASGQGVGQALLEKEIEESESMGIWTLLSLIIEENVASIKLHEKCGFRLVGVRERPAKMSKTGIWHNVVHMERRSKKVGL